MNDTRPVLMPKARKDQLIIKELPDETLVYDQESDQAHCLNDSAALVWKSCDGNNSVSDVKALLARRAGVPVDENVVWLALEQLEKFKLLERGPTPQVFAGMNRRHLIRNLGVTAIALPVVVSIVAPTPAQAASCGDTCANNGDCSGNPVGCRKCNASPSGPVCGP